MAEAIDDTDGVYDSPEIFALARKDLERAKAAIMPLLYGWRQALDCCKYKSCRQIAQEMNISVKTLIKLIRYRFFVVKITCW